MKIYGIRILMAIDNRTNKEYYIILNNQNTKTANMLKPLGEKQIKSWKQKSKIIYNNKLKQQSIHRGNIGDITSQSKNIVLMDVTEIDNYIAKLDILGIEHNIRYIGKDKNGKFISNKYYFKNNDVTLYAYILDKNNTIISILNDNGQIELVRLTDQQIYELLFKQKIEMQFLNADSVIKCSNEDLLKRGILPYNFSTETENMIDGLIHPDIKHILDELTKNTVQNYKVDGVVINYTKHWLNEATFKFRDQTDKLYCGPQSIYFYNKEYNILNYTDNIHTIKRRIKEFDDAVIKYNRARNKSKHVIPYMQYKLINIRINNYIITVYQCKTYYTGNNSYYFTIIYNITSNRCVDTTKNIQLKFGGDVMNLAEDIEEQQANMDRFSNIHQFSKKLYTNINDALYNATKSLWEYHKRKYNVK